MLAGLNPGQDEIDEMIEETDKDHSGAIDFRWVDRENLNIDHCTVESSVV